MISEAQHSKFRQDIRSNLAVAIEAAGGDDDRRAEVALAACQVTGQVMIAERISELSLAVSSTNELVAEQKTEIDGFKYTLKSALEALQRDDAHDAEWIIENSLGEGIDQKNGVVDDG